MGEDTAALYSGGWAAAGQVWHHNWVHDTTEKCLRFDDQSENATIHHNVIYNCGQVRTLAVSPPLPSFSHLLSPSLTFSHLLSPSRTFSHLLAPSRTFSRALLLARQPASDPSSAFNSGLGLVLKGDGHVVYANTIFRTNFSEMCLSSCIEKLKPFRRQYPRIMQNAHSQIFNTAANRSVGRCECGAGAPPGGNLTGIYTGIDLGLVNVAAHDYRPTAASPLVDAGVLFPPYTDGFVGAAPDIGAYERGGEAWVAGCVGMEGC